MRAPLRLVVFALANVAMAQSPDVPGDREEIWILLDDLARRGALISHMSGVRPLPRLEIARLLEEARFSERERVALTPTLSTRLDEALERFSTERLLIRGDFDATLIRPLDEVRGGVVSLEENRRPEPDRGRNLSEGLDAFLALSSWGQLSSGLAWAVEPELRYERLFDSGEGDLGFESRLREGYIRAPFLGTDLTLGRQSLRWGQGRHDTLVLGDTVGPLNLVRLSSRFTEVSWFGPLRFDVFLARLENDRAVEHPWLGGTKVACKPIPELELGLARTFLFGGDGRSIPGGDVLFPHDESFRDPAAASAPQVSLDWRLEVLGIGNGVSLYGETSGFELEDGLPTRFSHLAGVALADPLGLDDITVTLEWARLHEHAFESAAYPDGVTWRDAPLGHHVGPDAEDLSFSLQWNLDEDSRFEVSLDRELYFVRGARERLDELGLGWRQDLGDDVSLSVEGRRAWFQERQDEWIWQVAWSVRL